MGGKSKKSKSPAVADPFLWNQPTVYYDPSMGLYYSLGKNDQRSTNFSMIPMLNAEAMKAQQNVYVPTMAEMFPTVSSPLTPSALLDAQIAMNEGGGAGAGRFLGLLGSDTQQS